VDGLRGRAGRVSGERSIGEPRFLEQKLGVRRICEMRAAAPAARRSSCVRAGSQVPQPFHLPRLHAFVCSAQRARPLPSAGASRARAPTTPTPTPPRPSGTAQAPGTHTGTAQARPWLRLYGQLMYLLVSSLTYSFRSLLGL
jgi:hypothetical protein